MVVVSGAAAVENASGTWVVPAGFAAWIPAKLRHAIDPQPAARTRTLYVHAQRRDFRRACATLQVTPLLRALADQASLAGISGERRVASHRRLIDVFFDQLAVQRELPLFLPRLRSPLAQRVEQVLAADPADTPRLRDLAAELGVSIRTLERAFSADTGLPLGEWRQRTRICRAIAWLAEGMDVKDVALEVGYETPSAFVVAFKKYVGATPGTISRS